MILSDPINPIGKEVLAGTNYISNVSVYCLLALGYTTKVYFNACCIPSPLFNKTLVHQLLPLSIGPGYIGDTLQTLVQLLIDFCNEPYNAIKMIATESNNGPQLKAITPSGETIYRNITSPTKLSSYWSDVYYYSQLFKCCDNFLSAIPPSAPCLLCHSFGMLSVTSNCNLLILPYLRIICC